MSTISVEVNARARQGRFFPGWWLRLPEHVHNAYRRLTPRDTDVVEMQTWWHGTLPRLPVEEVLEDAARIAFCMVNPGLRRRGTSITLFELSCLLMAERAARTRRALEIGTFDGNTTLNLAANLPEGGEVVTIDLPGDGPHLVGAQFKERPEAARIRQIRCDSAALDVHRLGGPFDLAFIDGCHSYEYVHGDTRRVLEVMRPGGLVLWHDYAMLEPVSRAVDELRGRFDPLVALAGTRLALGVVPA
jgi:hypothetical protein